MVRASATVRNVMGILDSMDDYIDEFFRGLDGDDYWRRLFDSNILDRIYEKILGDASASRSAGSDNRSAEEIAVIPGDGKGGCHRTLLVFLFYPKSDLWALERLPFHYPVNTIMDKALNYAEGCPVLRDIIFYGPFWSTSVWGNYRNRFRGYNVYLKLFLSTYSVLRP
ncbi:hypothetical protein DMB44_08880 [Thermoplasma sp. Kam2015]|uniref:hypothetical protein n=1 Tax=Thermoplasma sp. Kam2015 TaxID=2094122 RepID=UPI000D9D64E6|nr:hypothetical protein [Thermoplasma sp. Kam2015]PYB67522.1 hypothetical protein DMB44_08880 [Thermoplasma sp. Kam2015]